MDGGGDGMARAADGARHDPEVVRRIAETVGRSGLDVEIVDGNRVLVTLPGEKKLKTTCLMTVWTHSVDLEAFVCRRPDEDHEKVYRYLLRRNRRLYGIAYTLDDAGDIYLVGRHAVGNLDEAEIDRILGSVLEAADGDFNTLLELGFHSSIRREWEWRVSRGESLRNLEAFRHLVDDA